MFVAEKVLLLLVISPIDQTSGDKPKFRNLIHIPTHLVCNAYRIESFLSFYMSLVFVMNCGAGNALRGFEIGMF